jgi:hypothetical protein
MKVNNENSSAYQNQNVVMLLILIVFVLISLAPFVLSFIDYGCLQTSVLSKTVCCFNGTWHKSDCKMHSNCIVPVMPGRSVDL